MRTDLTTALQALRNFVLVVPQKRLETARACRALFAIFSLADRGLGTVDGDIAACASESQLSDGGWSDPEETAWALGALSVSGEMDAVAKGTAWLNSARHPAGGWGRHPRDQVRIITTALVIALVPEVATEADWNWLRQEWGRDLERPVKLSYKGGFYLLAEKRDAEPSLPEATIRFLEGDQNDDGGFGPWRDHPIGSDPWSTGVVLWGLSRWIDRVDRTVIERALGWLERTQLPSGYWPYHYLDEGTSYALIGAVSALKALKRL